MIELNKKNFKREAKSKDIVIVDFYAPYCGPCIEMEPILRAAEGKYKGKIKFCRLNFDEFGSIAAENDVGEIPTLLAFKDGEEIDRIIGSYSEYALNAKISEWLMLK